MSKIKLIWSEDLNGLIGNNNQLPWYIPKEFKHFKDTTSGHHVIMGRHTFESLDCQPLPNRINCVLSFSKLYDTVVNIKSRDDIINFKSIEEAIDYYKTKNIDLYVIGGSTVYNQFLPICDELIRTVIDGKFSGDTYFPYVDYSQFELTKVDYYEKDDNNLYSFKIEYYKRKSSNLLN